MHFSKRFTCIPLALLALAAQAQTVPDAGQTLQQLTPPVAAPRASQPPRIESPQAAGNLLPGGAKVLLDSVEFSGNSMLADEVLRPAVQEALGTSLDMAGLRALAQRVGALYRAQGYPFARAYLPPQDLTHGHLRIAVVEGRYGRVAVRSEEPGLILKAERFLHTLVSDTPIEGAALERATLLLDDQPGIKTSPVIRPGAQDGSGDLDVLVTRDKAVTGDVGLSNYGNYYTGEAMARASVNINSPFTLGDQISVHALASDYHLLLGSVGYAMPLGGNGLRANVGYATTSYVLGKEFASLVASGTAVVSSAGLSYPLVRSQKTNLNLSATYQLKDLKDKRDAAGTKETKSSDSLPLVLQFDRRDSLGGSGITYGSVGWTAGRLALDDGLTAADSNATRGDFTKLNLDVVRLQALPGGFSLMGRLSMQRASKNLDSSEKMALGGAAGVRAYPTGEASGDEGVLGQLELRYQLGDYAPYLFLDNGTIRSNARPAVGATSNERTLGGVGLGLRYQRGDWNTDAALAWPTEGGAPQAESSTPPQPRIWVNAGMRF